MLRLTILGNTSAFPRICTEDLHLWSGYIPAGSAIYPDVFLANRDQNAYENPLMINPFRTGPKHLQFGYGMHHCMGRELAKIEICFAVRVIMKMLPNLRFINGIELLNIPWNEGIILRRPKSLPVVCAH